MKMILAAINAKYIHSNLAVYSLKAYAEAYAGFGNGVEGQGESVCELGIAEYTINQPLEQILMDVYRKRPDVLCFSCYLWNIRYVEQLVTEIGKVLPDVEVWLGGPEVSWNAVEVLERLPRARGVMCGEGEETFLELVRFYAESGDGGPETAAEGECSEACGSGLRRIRGIAYREQTGEIVRNPDRQPMPDLNRIPFVYRHMEDFEHKIIYYESSRGCPFSCSYCLSSVDKCLRFRDLDLVREELQFLIDRQVPQVKFVDRTFNCRHGHALEIWRYLAEHDRGVTNFHFEVAADLLNEEEMELIASMRPGLIQLEIGIQSVNEQTIREIRRTMKFDQVRERVLRIHRQGNVHQHLDLIAGLPFEDYDSFRDSFDKVYALRPEQLQLGFLKVLKGSYMAEQAKKYELLYQDCPPFEVLSTKWLSYDDIIRLKGIEEMVEVYYNSRQYENTMELLEGEFEDAFAMFEALRDYYEERNLYQVNHTRMARYEILVDFLREKTAGGYTEQYRESMTYDLYLRENVKNRPAFAGAQNVDKETAAAFYEREERERCYLPGYEMYDKRQMRKMTHLEYVGGRLLLFDYRNRNPLTKQAKVSEVLFTS